MKVLHFIGEGSGFMRGITEYVVVLDNPDEDYDVTEEECAPGFELKSETEIDDLPSSFPFNTTLIPHV